MKPQVVIFDLDGTLAESKQPIDVEMATLLGKLLKEHYVAVISGGGFHQFEKQFLTGLALAHSDLQNLILLPTSGASLYRYSDSSWEKEYEEILSEDDVEQVMYALNEAKRIFGFELQTEFGPTIENRGPQITLSPLGQNAPIAVKEPWDPHQEKRKKMVDFLKPLLPDFNLSMGGMTSIDITKSGINKEYGIHKVSDALGIPIENMVYVGDALFPGGNDEAARKTGITCIEVKTIEDTKNFIRNLVQ